MSHIGTPNAHSRTLTDPKIRHTAADRVFGPGPEPRSSDPGRISGMRGRISGSGAAAAGERGFTLIEIQVSLVVMAIVASMTVVSVQNVLTAARGDTAMMQVAGLMRLGRDTAIAQRRTIDVVFVEPNAIELVRRDVPEGTTVIGRVSLENGATLQRDSELVGPDGDTSGSAIDFDDAETLSFQPDGMFTDGASVPVNGAVYTAVRGEAGSARAVTLTGSSGRAECFRWNGKVWEEQ